MGNVCCSSKNDLPQPKNNEEVSRIKGALDKNSCNSIFRSLPRRETTNLDSFKNIIKQKTNGLSDKEKAYVLFLWVCDNISYDVDAYFAGRDVQCEPEDVFRNGITVCSGYARLYQNINI
jgi:transglutaminase/protease-like cytokinesis protein 3